MGKADVLITELRSRRTRSRILGKENTTRKIAKPDDEKSLLPTSLVKAIGGFFGNAAKFTGWLIGSAIGFVGFSFTAIWAFLVQVSTFIYNFNWNASDKELDQYLQAIKIQIASQLGGTLGNLAGYIACGFAPAYGIFVFNEPLGLFLLEKVGEEALDELLGNLRALLNTAFNGLVSYFIISSYKGLRRAIKSYFKNPNSQQSQMFKKIFGSGFDNAVKSWGAENSKPWSFAKAIEDKIESIKDPVTQNFVEEFYDEFLDGCVEAGYVIAGGLDEWVIAQKEAATAILGPERVIEIQPDREAEEESYIIAGREELVKEQAVSLMTQHQLMEGKDLGMFVGEPLTEQARKKRPSLTIKIQFYDSPSPPWFKSGITPRRASYKIPGIKRSKVDWETIKTAAGGHNGYMWGRFLATANLKDDNDAFAGQMQIWGATGDEAKDRLYALLTLSELTLSTLSITEEKKEGLKATNKAMYKEPTRLYPAHFTIVNTEKVLNADTKGKNPGTALEGVQTLSGTYRKRSSQIDLWPSQKPPDTDRKIQYLLSPISNF